MLAPVLLPGGILLNADAGRLALPQYRFHVGLPMGGIVPVYPLLPGIDGVGTGLLGRLSKGIVHLITAVGIGVGHEFIGAGVPHSGGDYHIVLADGEVQLVVVGQLESPVQQCETPVGALGVAVPFVLAPVKVLRAELLVGVVAASHGSPVDDAAQLGGKVVGVELLPGLLLQHLQLFLHILGRIEHIQLIILAAVVHKVIAVHLHDGRADLLSRYHQLDAQIAALLLRHIGQGLDPGHHALSVPIVPDGGLPAGGGTLDGPGLPVLGVYFNDLVGVIFGLFVVAPFQGALGHAQIVVDLALVDPRYRCCRRGGRPSGAPILHHHFPRLFHGIFAPAALADKDAVLL